MIGSTLGVYRVLDKLGEGGMGQVYVARDTRLGRDVAVKVLPEAFLSDPDRTVRFEREAKMLAALNHPHVASLLSMEEAAGRHFLVMELVPGPTLAERIQQGRLPLIEILDVARQVADALAAAHELGIIHRDLKPANIKIRPDGTVKVLDFGLAKALEAPGQRAGSAAFDTDSPTALATGPTSGGATNISQVGLILGTAPYMSPEQANGKPVDRRADVWAFGCVLYEMLTGEAPFTRDTISESLAAIMRDEPDWTKLPPETPPSVVRLVRRCLIKDPKERLSDVGVARLEIRDAASADPSTASAAVPARAPRRSSRGLAVCAGLAGGLAIAAMIAIWLWPSPRPLPTLNLALDWPANLTWVGRSGTGLAVSADGTHLAYIAVKSPDQPQLHVRDLRSGEVRVLPSADSAYNPFFSPDSSQVGFIAASKLWRAPLSGGSPFEIGSIDPGDRGVAWSADGYVYTGGGAGISRIAESGGQRETITTVNRAAGELAHRFPAIVPGGRGVVFTIFKGSLTDARVAVVDLSTKTYRILFDLTGHAPVYTRTGHLLYLRAGVLMAAPFDASRLEVTGPSVPVLNGVLYNNGGAGHFAVAETGTLVYVGDAARREPTDLVWIDPSGRSTAVDIPPGAYANPQLSPEGSRVALERRDAQGKSAVVVWDFGRRVFTTVTRDPGLSDTPIWTPDGANLVFTSRSVLGAIGRLFMQRADGSGAPAQLSSAPIRQQFATAGEYAGSISPDGAKLVFSEVSGEGDGIKVIDLSTKQVELLVPRGRNPRLSPNGKWLAYRLAEFGIGEIYISPYPNVAGGRWQVSSGGASSPRWSSEGRELLYRGLDSTRSRMYSFRLAADGALGTVRPQLLFDVSAAPPPSSPREPGALRGDLDEFDVARDGRFLVVKAPATSREIPQVIVNWFELLQTRNP